jgi:hypothetical protein
MKATFTILSIFAIGIFVAAINRMFYFTLNSDNITRTPEGNINWNWCIFTFVTTLFVGGLVSVFVGVFIIEYTSFTDLQKYAVAGASAIAGEKIWLILKNALEKKADQVGDTI